MLGTHFTPALTNATYATYLRCHDDIGWAVTDEDAAAVGLSGPAHRASLSDFYEGAFPGSFARGAPFQRNPATGDLRVSGTLASLAGVERALEVGDVEALDRAVDRILLGHALISSIGGIPLVYMGDEIALLNDYGYRDEPTHAHDSRWLHRPAMDWGPAALARADPASLPGRVWHGLQAILARRAVVPELHGAHPTAILRADDPAVFAFARQAPWGDVLCLYNMSERWTAVLRARAAAAGMAQGHELLSDGRLDPAAPEVALPPYARAWLR